MDDATIHERIEKLVNEEQELWKREAEGEPDDATRRRLAEVKVSLDQSWDLLRQREALRRAHMDPDVAVELRLTGTGPNVWGPGFGNAMVWLAQCR